MLLLEDFGMKGILYLIRTWRSRRCPYLVYLRWPTTVSHFFSTAGPFIFIVSYSVYRQSVNPDGDLCVVFLNQSIFCARLAIFLELLLYLCSLLVHPLRLEGVLNGIGTQLLQLIAISAV